MKIISGGQTGVDRAALDAAMARGIEYGGSVPRGRKAEDGPIDKRYTALTELSRAGYPVRTEKNVADGDATLILAPGAPTEGTAYTVECARRRGRPCLVVDIQGRDDDEIVKQIEEWFLATGPVTLNVAGPRESKSPGIYERAYRIFLKLFPLR
jgi:hypothetical protein